MTQTTIHLVSWHPVRHTVWIYNINHLADTLSIICSLELLL